MKKVGSPKLLFENLDLTPVHPILWTDLHKEGLGRPVKYNPEWDLKALLMNGVYFKAANYDDLNFMGNVHESFQDPYMEKRLREGSTFIDVGAHLGGFTILALSLAGRPGFRRRRGSPV